MQILIHEFFFFLYHTLPADFPANTAKLICSVAKHVAVFHQGLLVKTDIVSLWKDPLQRSSSIALERSS